MDKEKVCKYCGRELKPKELKKTHRQCFKCGQKSVLLPCFVKARDDLRERLGLPRMGSANDG